MFYQNPIYQISVPMPLLLGVLAAHRWFLLWKIALVLKEAVSLEDLCHSSQVSLKPITGDGKVTKVQSLCHKVGPTLVQCVLPSSLGDHVEVG